MFDLNVAVMQWRESLEQGESMAKPDLDELESHLRDQVDDLGGSGLSEEEAFWVGTHRLGDSAALQREFTKIDNTAYWRKRLFWMAAGSLFFYLLVHLSFVCGELFTMAGMILGFRGLELAVANTVGLFISIICFLLLFYLSFVSRWIEPGIRYFLHGSRKKVILLAVLVTSLILLITFHSMLFLPLKTKYLNHGEFQSIQTFRFWSLAIWTTACPLMLVFVLYKLKGYRGRSRQDDLVVG
jgi:hypothetical protein